MTVEWRQLAGFGFSVFALRPKDKRPASSWQDHQKRHATEAELAAWSRDRALNAAVACGAISGVIVLDTDSAEAEAEVQRRGMPATPVVRTSKGRHYYLAHPGGAVRNFAHKLPGMDLRGDGGYVVAAGSVHPSGHVYTWERSPAELPFAAPPAWLLELLRSPATVAEPVARLGDRYAEKALDNELSALRRAGEGQRNDTLNRAAFNLGQLVGAGALDRLTVERHLLSMALNIGLTEPESRATIASGLEDGMQQPRAIPEPRQVRPVGRAPVADLQQERQRRTADARRAPAAAVELIGVDPITLQDVPVPPREWVVPQWVPDHDLTMLAGDGGIGKSLLMQQLLTSVGTGKPWLGTPVQRRKAVALFAEDNLKELHRRQADINRHHRLEMGDLEDVRWFPRTYDDNLLCRFTFDGTAEPTELYNQLLRAAQDFGAQLVVIDTLAAVFGGNENDRHHAQTFGALLRRMAIEINGAVILCSHPSLSGQSSGSGQSGSTGWNAVVRSRLYLEFAKTEEGASATEERTLTRKKSNYARAGEEITLRWDDGVLVNTEEARAPEFIMKRSAEAAFIDALKELNTKGFDVTDSAKSERYAPRWIAGMPNIRPFKEADLARAMKALLIEGKVKIEPYGPPSKGWRRLIVPLCAV